MLICELPCLFVWNRLEICRFDRFGHFVVVPRQSFSLFSVLLRLVTHPLHLFVVVDQRHRIFLAAFLSLNTFIEYITISFSFSFLSFSLQFNWSTLKPMEDKIKYYYRKWFDEFFLRKLQSKAEWVWLEFNWIFKNFENKNHVLFWIKPVSQ